MNGKAAKQRIRLGIYLNLAKIPRKGTPIFVTSARHRVAQRIAVVAILGVFHIVYGSRYPLPGSLSIFSTKATAPVRAQESRMRPLIRVFP